MPIDFQQIPVAIRVPGVYVEVDNRVAFRGLFRLRERILVIGQKLASGTAAADTPIRVRDENEAALLFGRGSMLHEMFTALKRANSFTDTFALPVEDFASGSVATGSIRIGGAPAAGGVINLYVAGQRVRTGVAAAEAASVTATNLVADINEAADLPVTAAVDGADNTQVNLTARHAGEAGNDIDLRFNYFVGEDLPPGLTAVVSSPMAGGAGNPEIADALAALGDEKFEHIVMPYTDLANLSDLEALLKERWGPLKMIEAFAYAARAGSLSELSTFGDSRNCELISIMGAQDSPTPPYVWAAVYGAVIAFNANQDPVRPFQTLELPGVLASDNPVNLFTLEERDILLFDGISTFLVDDDGTVRIERAITTYQENAQGIPDPSFLDVNTVLTLSFVRRDLRFFLARDFPRHKLADDGTPIAPGQAIATPGIIRDQILGRFLQWQDAGIAENVEQFKAQLVVERNADDVNRVDVLVPVNIVNQLRVIAVLQQFRL